MARALAGAGVNAVIFDPVGTGDSAGEFSDFSLPGLAADVAAVNDWLDARDAGPRALWGLRLGASLAAQIGSSDVGRYKGLLLWSPVLNGRQYLRQFLRIRVAADFGRDSAKKLTVTELEDRLSSGEPVNVGGYPLTPTLAEQVGGTGVASQPAPEVDWLAWFESRASDDMPQSNAVTMLQQSWGANIGRFHAESVVGPTFWTQVEPQPAPELERATLETIAGIVT